MDPLTELVARDKVYLDIFWLKDAALDESGPAAAVRRNRY